MNSVAVQELLAMRDAVVDLEFDEREILARVSWSDDLTPTAHGVPARWLDLTEAAPGSAGSVVGAKRRLTAIRKRARVFAGVGYADGEARVPENLALVVRAVWPNFAPAERLFDDVEEV